MKRKRFVFGILMMLGLFVVFGTDVCASAQGSNYQVEQMRRRGGSRRRSHRSRNTIHHSSGSGSGTSSPVAWIGSIAVFVGVIVILYIVWRNNSGCE